MGNIDSKNLHGGRSEMGMLNGPNGGSVPLPVQAPGLVSRSGVTQGQYNAIVGAPQQSLFPVRRAQPVFQWLLAALDLLEIHALQREVEDGHGVKTRRGLVLAPPW